MIVKKPSHALGFLFLPFLLALLREHIDYKFLFGLRQLGDTLHLLLQLRRWPAFLGCRCRCCTDQIFYRHSQRLREYQQCRYRYAAVAHLIGIHWAKSIRFDQ